MSELKLIALDDEDLKVLSAHLQDAVLKVGDIAYLAAEKRFVVLANRFDWTNALSQPESRRHKAAARGKFTRYRCALRFEQVTAARLRGIDLAAKDQVLSMLALQFEPSADQATEGQAVEEQLTGEPIDGASAPALPAAGEQVEPGHRHQCQHRRPFQPRLRDAGDPAALALDRARGRRSDDPPAHRQQQQGDKVDAEGEAAALAVVDQAGGARLVQQLGDEEGADDQTEDRIAPGFYRPQPRQAAEPEQKGRKGQTGHRCDQRRRVGKYENDAAADPCGKGDDRLCAADLGKKKAADHGEGVAENHFVAMAEAVEIKDRERPKPRIGEDPDRDGDRREHRRGGKQQLKRRVWSGGCSRVHRGVEGGQGRERGATTTVRLRTPWAPWMSTPSMSAVADGPVISTA